MVLAISYIYAVSTNNPKAISVIIIPTIMAKIPNAVPIEITYSFKYILAHKILNYIFYSTIMVYLISWAKLVSGLDGSSKLDLK